jgi:hypothetical protein
MMGPARTPGGQRGPVVQREHGLDGKAFEKPVFHHPARTGAAFLTGLEDEMHRAVEIGP